MTEQKKRKQLTVNLGEHHDAFIKLAESYKVKPATLASMIIKQTVSEEIQSGNKKLAELIFPTKSKKVHQHLRLREDELKVLDEYASIMGQTLHQALIGLVRAMTVNEPQFTIGELESLENSNYELHKIGVNLNQIAHKINSMELDEFKKNQSSVVISLINILIDSADECKKNIDKHIDAVWKLINSSRYRTELKHKLRH